MNFRLFLLAPTFVIVCIWLYLQSQEQTPRELPFEIGTLKIGHQIPPFDLQIYPNGGTLPISKLDSELILLSFWASWCQTCVDEIPQLVALASKFDSKTLQILTINLDESPNKNIASALKKFDRIPSLHFQDPDGLLAEAFGVLGLPKSYLLDRQRKLLWIQGANADWINDTFSRRIHSWLIKSRSQQMNPRF